MEFLAPAKINLFLEVTGRRPDGYHDLETIFQAVTLFDRITLAPHKNKLILECNKPDLPCDERNLAMRAAMLLKKEAGVKCGVKIKLEKNIPLGAGLGGGSSDAAAVLKALISFWGLKVSRQKLNKMALALGADVPFFLSGGTAHASGIGEKLTPLKGVAPANYILIYPGFPVSTAETYQKLRFPLTRKQKITKMKSLLTSGSAAPVWGPYMFNRLEEAVLPRYRMVRHVKDTLKRYGCESLMSGSGSTVFAPIHSQDEGEVIKSKLKKFPWNVFLVGTY